MTVVAVIQARMRSSRLPGKILAEIAGRPVLRWMVEAARAIPAVDTVIVATSSGEADDPVEAWCDANDVRVHRGDENDVLARVADAANAAGADVVLRLTADCPFLDPTVCGAVAALVTESGYDYANNTDPPQWPDGLDCEAMTMEALRTTRREATLPSEREHVTPFIRKRRGRFRIGFVGCPLPGLTRHRWTLDDDDDLAFLRAVAEKLDTNGRVPSYLDVLALLRRHPELARPDAAPHRGPAFTVQGQDARARELVDAPRSFDATVALFSRALESVPLASQTFSKSSLQFPVGQCPLFLTHGQGGRVFDVDGNEYVDLMSGLHTVLLGYRDPDVDRAIGEQLACGISFSLSTALEADLAERLIEIIPSAERVRFGKNGSDATAAAVRLARAFTGRDRIVACGYHGWHDWYIGTTTRNKGVPAGASELTLRAPYNDLDAMHALLRRHPGEIAAVILEPMTGEEPAPGYLEGLQELVRAEGALLVFDEIITGFRFAVGGAQELFGVTPDLSTFGKGMANGMPLSAIVGRADVMREMEDIFFSGTFGGETLSLAAAIAVVDKVRREPVIERIWESGAELAAGVDKLIVDHGLSSVMRLAGKAPWKILKIADHDKASSLLIQTLFKREMLAHGVLIGGGHNINYAHHAADMSAVLKAYDAALATIVRELDRGAPETRLNCAMLQPVFAVRP